MEGYVIFGGEAWRGREKGSKIWTEFVIWVLNFSLINACEVVQSKSLYYSLTFPSKATRG